MCLACQAFLVLKWHSSSSDRKRIVSNRRSRLSVSERTRLSITTDCRKTLVIFTKMPRDLPLRQSSGCMGGNLSAVVDSTSRRPRTSMCLVKAGSRPVQIATPAFQSTPGLPRAHRRSSGVLSTILRKSLDT